MFKNVYSTLDELLMTFEVAEVVKDTSTMLNSSLAKIYLTSMYIEMIKLIEE